MQKFQLYINGQFENGAAQFDSINPATGEIWAKCQKHEQMKSIVR